MKPAPLRYSRPGSTAEALALLASLGEDGKVLAGGQSLVPLLSMRLAAPEHLVDINRLAELGYVRVVDGQVRVGALARHAQVLADRRSRPLGLAYWLLTEAGPKVVLPARGQVLWLKEAERWRQVRKTLEEWVVTLVGHIRAGKYPLRPRSEYCTQTCDFGQICRITQARAGYLSVGPSPIVLDLTEGAAADGTDGFAAAADLARQQLDPEPDIHATADYRRHLAGVLTQRTLLEALGEAQVRGTAPGRGARKGRHRGGTARD